MKNVHLIIPDLLLTTEYSVDLSLPYLHKMLVRGQHTQHQAVALESWLCQQFGLPHDQHTPIAQISALFDGLPNDGAKDIHWLRADPVYLQLQRDKLILMPNLDVALEEAQQLCASLSSHFAEQQLTFFAPHPQRWYLKLNSPAEIKTVNFSVAIGQNIDQLLPQGPNSLDWHRLFNEVQMLLFNHPVNQKREEAGQLPINSVWMWGNGQMQSLQSDFDEVHSDEVLAQMLAHAAQINFRPWSPRWQPQVNRQLIIYNGLRQAMQRGDIHAWRVALQEFENNYAEPLWQALRNGKIQQICIDIISKQERRHCRLRRADSWAFWRKGKI